GDVVDQIFARLDYDATTLTPHWYLTDHQGTIRDIVDADGDLQGTVSYDAFGNITSDTSARGRYGWDGREIDEEIDLEYNRARYYSPELGRWITQDPLGFDAGDSNLYRYVNNRPTSFTDPSGLEREFEAEYRQFLREREKSAMAQKGPPPSYEQWLADRNAVLGIKTSTSPAYAAKTLPAKKTEMPIPRDKNGYPLPEQPKLPNPPSLPPIATETPKAKTVPSPGPQPLKDPLPPPQMPEKEDPEVAKYLDALHNWDHANMRAFDDVHRIRPKALDVEVPLWFDPATSVVLDIHRDGLELITGRDLLTQDDIGIGGRILAGVSVFLPLVNGSQVRRLLGLAPQASGLSVVPRPGMTSRTVTAPNGRT